MRVWFRLKRRINRWRFNHRKDATARIAFAEFLDRLTGACLRDGDGFEFITTHYYDGYLERCRREVSRRCFTRGGLDSLTHDDLAEFKKLAGELRATAV